MKRLVVLVLLAAAGCGESGAPARRAAEPVATPVEPVATVSCRPPRVNHTPYPGGDEGMATIPWLRGQPRRHGLVGLLWYWPEEWQGVRRARVFTGGVAPAGYSAKVLWTFLDPSARESGGGELVIEAENLTGPGRWRDTFSAISYDGQEGRAVLRVDHRPAEAGLLASPAHDRQAARLRRHPGGAALRDQGAAEMTAPDP